MIDFVGAGPGAIDLITVRGKTLLEKADVVIYAGSLVNPALLSYTKEGAQLFDSAKMTLEEILRVMIEADAVGKNVVRLQTGDPSLYGAIREQMDALEKEGISYRSCPGVTAAFGAAAACDLEYTLPGVTQTLILTRMTGKTAVPEREEIRSLAAHQASMAIYLSAGMLKVLSARLTEGGYPPETPALLVYKATWPEEAIYPCTIATLPETGERHQVTKTALVLVGEALRTKDYERSKLYDPAYTTLFRTGSDGGTA
ncbi:MAG: precorrin-4 C(11)-methyltransferase [Lachnospiraceae bacterium]|nr:precorrin-4 C(11)-methyltransferase [Lachnospiraceae bacterium]